MMELSTRTLGDWLEHWALTTPDKEYIVYSDRNLRFTWKQFNERVVNPEKPYVPLNKNDAFQKVQKRRVQKKTVSAVLFCMTKAHRFSFT